jgi:peptide/nickel transport system permease protein
VGSKEATWGGAIAEASQNIGTQPWLLVPSGLLVITFILALGLLGDAVRDVMAEEYGETRPTVTRRRRARAAAKAAAAPVATDALLSVHGLTVAFPRDGVDVPVVTGVDFEVRAGEAVGILGESGCGKSVTARSVLGLLPGSGHVTAGSIVFEGRDLLRASRDELRAVRGGRIGWISQEPINSLDPTFTIGSQLVEAIRAHRSCSRKEAYARALELLALVRLPDPAATAAKYPYELSGGMAQRAGIACALAADPVMLIADEPTTALDVTVQAEILDLLRELQACGMAIILVTHDLGVLNDLCERAVVMYAGQVVETASVADLAAGPQHPYTAALVAANPHDAVPGAPLLAIEGVVPSPGQWSEGCRFANRCPLVEPRCEAAPIPLVPLGDRRTRCVKPEAVGIALREKEEVLS